MEILLCVGEQVFYRTDIFTTDIPQSHIYQS